MNKLLLVASLLLISVVSFSQTKRPIVSFVNPAVLPPPVGYTSTVQIDLGAARMIIVSGLVAFDKDRNVIASGDMKKQVEVIFTNLKAVVGEAGGSMKDVVKLGIFLTDITQVQTVRDVRDQFVNREHPPASTTVEVSRLVKEGLVAEIEATIVIPYKQE